MKYKYKNIKRNIWFIKNKILTLSILILVNHFSHFLQNQFLFFFYSASFTRGELAISVPCISVPVPRPYAFRTWHFLDVLFFEIPFQELTLD